MGFYKTSLALLAFFSVLTGGGCTSRAYDIVLKNGKVYDGSGGFIYSMDIGIKADRVVAVGKLHSLNAKKTIDVYGQTIVPWIPSDADLRTIVKHQVIVHYQNAFHTYLKDGTQTVETAIRFVFSKKGSVKEKGAGLIGAGFSANLLVLDLQKTNAYVPFTQLPKDALGVTYVIYQGAVLP